MLAIEIACGVILAVVVLALLPFLLALLPYIAALAVVVGAVLMAWLIWPGTAAPLLALVLAGAVAAGGLTWWTRRLDRRPH